MCSPFPMCVQLSKQEEPLLLQVRKQPSGRLTAWPASAGRSGRAGSSGSRDALMSLGP